MEKLVTFIASPEGNARLRKWFVVMGYVAPTSAIICVAVAHMTGILSR